MDASKFELVGRLASFLLHQGSNCTPASAIQWQSPCSASLRLLALTQRSAWCHLCLMGIVFSPSSLLCNTTYTVIKMYVSGGRPLLVHLEYVWTSAEWSKPGMWVNHVHSCVQTYYGFISTLWKQWPSRSRDFLDLIAAWINYTGFPSGSGEKDDHVQKLHWSSKSNFTGLVSWVWCWHFQPVLYLINLTVSWPSDLQLAR